MNRPGLASLVERERAAYLAARPRSLTLAREAAPHFLASVPMHWMRDWPLPSPLYVQGASGAGLTDVDGHRYVDFCLGDTGAMAGHAPGPVVRAVAERAAAGITAMLPTEDAAWAKAEAIREATAVRLAAAEGLYGKNNRFIAGESASVADRRLRETAARKEVHDERLWFGITALTGQGGNSTAHVGTPAQVAEALGRYHDIGVDRFLIRGFEPLEDVQLWAQALIPELRSRLTERVETHV